MEKCKRHSSLKNRDETQMENYRPISVQPVVAKIMEHIVLNQL